MREAYKERCGLSKNHGSRYAGNAKRTGVAVDVERKVALLLEHGVRADRQAAEKLVVQMPTCGALT